MIDPMSLNRMAVRIEALVFQSMHGWDNADAMDYRNRLPGGRSPNALPDPKMLREKARNRASNDITEAQYQAWLQVAMHLEGLVRDNNPMSPKRIIRDMVRGRLPY